MQKLNCRNKPSCLRGGFLLLKIFSKVSPWKRAFFSLKTKCRTWARLCFLCFTKLRKQEVLLWCSAFLVSAFYSASVRVRSASVREGGTPPCYANCCVSDKLSFFTFSTSSFTRSSKFLTFSFRKAYGFEKSSPALSKTS